MEIFLFYFFGIIALVAAINVVRLRRVFHAALSLIVCLSSIAGIYMLLDAPFIAAVQIIVYAGAIMVLFLFVIMLLDPFTGGGHPDKMKSLRFLGLIMGSAILVLLVPLLRMYNPSRAPRDVFLPIGGTGNVTRLAETLFNSYLLPFEVTSVVILIAIIGVVVLAKRQA